MFIHKCYLCKEIFVVTLNSEGYRVHDNQNQIEIERMDKHEEMHDIASWPDSHIEYEYQ